MLFDRQRPQMRGDGRANEVLNVKADLEEEYAPRSPEQEQRKEHVKRRPQFECAPLKKPSSVHFSVLLDFEQYQAANEKAGQDEEQIDPSPSECEAGPEDCVNDRRSRRLVEVPSHRQQDGESADYIKINLAPHHASRLTHSSRFSPKCFQGSRVGATNHSTIALIKVHMARAAHEKWLISNDPRSNFACQLTRLEVAPS
jgi:hypothetical protein